jgi:hypothetical protein
VSKAILIVQSNPKAAFAFFLNFELHSCCIRELHSDFPENPPAFIAHVNHNWLFPKLHNQTA